MPEPLTDADLDALIDEVIANAPTVTTILDNPVYAGWLYDEGREMLIEAAHDGIVSHETWLAVRDIRLVRGASPGKGRGRNPARPHLLTRAPGRCGRCGGALIPRGDRYVCRNRHQYGDCDLPTIPRRRVDDLLLSEFAQRILDLPATIDAVREAAASLREDTRKERRRAEHDLATTEVAVQRIDRAYREGRMPESRYERPIVDAEAELEGAKAELDRLEANADHVAAMILAAESIDARTETIRRLKELREAVAGRLTSQANVEAVRETLRTIFDSIIVNADNEWGDLELLPAVREEAIFGYEANTSILDEDVSRPPYLSTSGDLSYQLQEPPVSLVTRYPGNRYVWVTALCRIRVS